MNLLLGSDARCSIVGRERSSRHAVALVEGAGIGSAPIKARTEAPWSVKKGGLWWITLRVRDEKPQVPVRAVTAPDLL